MNKFFDLLCSFSSPNVFNPWTDTDEQFDRPEQGPKTRLARLKAHFDTDPVALLVGEAPGYQGCRVVGQAFCNEKLILSGAIPRALAYGSRISKRPIPFSEPSATIVWGALHQHGIASRAVLWNAFAWHPHKEGNGQTNRAPTKFELDAGKDVLVELLQHFSGVPVLAVGRTSEGLLGKLGCKADGCLRHPAMGGATEFRRGLADWIGQREYQPAELSLA